MKDYYGICVKTCQGQPLSREGSQKEYKRAQKIELRDVGKPGRVLLKCLLKDRKYEYCEMMWSKNIYAELTNTDKWGQYVI